MPTPSAVDPPPAAPAPTTPITTTHDNQPTPTASTAPNNADNPPSSTNQRLPLDGASPSASSTAARQDDPTLFAVPDFQLALNASPETYKQHVRTLHKEMIGGELADYHESKIPLPRSLQGLKTSMVVAKLLTLNPSLNSDSWSTVTMDVVGNYIVLGTVSETGKAKIDALDELKLEMGRATMVPKAAKPNNMYHVELLLPHERELHVDFMDAFLRTFPTAKFIALPGKKPLGTIRRLRLTFNTVTAPREVFTMSDASVPIREVCLPCGTAAQVIHKWQRLNQIRPPHLASRWGTQAPTRTYAAAITQSHIPMPAPAPTLPAQLPIRRPTGNMRTHQPPERRPGVVPQGPQNYTSNSLSAVPMAGVISRDDDNDADWTSNAPLMVDEAQNPSAPAPAPRTENTTVAPDQAMIMEPTLSAAEIRNDLSTAPTSESIPPPRPATTTCPTGSTDNHNQPPAQRPSGRYQSRPVEPPQRAPKPNPAHPAPEENEEDHQQWHKVKKPRTKKASHHSKPSDPRTGLQRSGSRSSKQSTANKFAVLEFQSMPAFEDDETSPIEVILPSAPPKPPRRKYRVTKKAKTSQVTDALTHPQEVRHPGKALQHISPLQGQILLHSRDPALITSRERLVQQIALLRAVRANDSPQQIFLESPDDEQYMLQLKARISACEEPPDCSATTPIRHLVRALLERDDARIRSANYFARLDLATRMLLPHIYDMWPDQFSWLGIPLLWLPAKDADVPCLQDESLAALAASPHLSKVWEHTADNAPDLATAIQTAATQWRLYKARNTTPGTRDNVPTPTLK